MPASRWVPWTSTPCALHVAVALAALTCPGCQDHEPSPPGVEVGTYVRQVVRKGARPLNAESAADCWVVGDVNGSRVRLDRDSLQVWIDFDDVSDYVTMDAAEVEAARAKVKDEEAAKAAATEANRAKPKVPNWALPKPKSTSK
jgi:hypothetical protein